MDGWGGDGLCLEVELMKQFTKQGSKNKGIRAVRREPLRGERPSLLGLIVCSRAAAGRPDKGRSRRRDANPAPGTPALQKRGNPLGAGCRLLRQRDANVTS